MERTFVAVKPDGVQRSLIGEIITRFEKKGFKLVGLKLVQVTEELAKKHYEEHEGKSFFNDLVSFITSGPVVAMVWEGKGSVASVRKILGQTDPLKSEPGTIRGDYGISIGRNIVHASSDVEAAKREVALWFKEDELVSWESVQAKWIYE